MARRVSAAPQSGAWPSRLLSTGLVTRSTLPSSAPHHWPLIRHCSRKRPASSFKVLAKSFQAWRYARDRRRGRDQNSCLPPSQWWTTRPCSSRPRKGVFRLLECMVSLPGTQTASGSSKEIRRIAGAKPFQGRRKISAGPSAPQALQVGFGQHACAHQLPGQAQSQVQTCEAARGFVQGAFFFVGGVRGRGPSPEYRWFRP